MPDIKCVVGKGLGRCYCNSCVKPICLSNEKELGELAVGHLHSQHLAAVENQLLRVENRRLREELSEATKAGTPYSREQDGINGLVIDNQNKTVEIERLIKELKKCHDEAGKN